MSIPRLTSLLWVFGRTTSSPAGQTEVIQRFEDLWDTIRTRHRSQGALALGYGTADEHGCPQSPCSLASRTAAVLCYASSYVHEYGSMFTGNVVIMFEAKENEDRGGTCPCVPASENMLALVRVYVTR